MYQLKLDFSEGGKESDSKQVRFGVREVTYELSLLDSTGQLRRVDVSPTAARARGEQVVDVSHEGMRQIAGRSDTAPPSKEWRQGSGHQWVASLPPGAESSPAVRPVDDTKAAPYLVLKVNGVRIAARGGNWGMDDSRKRVSREKLEPYFRLHRDANVNIIRNWVGQNTEETFYDLADEYGLMVWNDFWASTQEYNVEPLDIPLFLDNVRDTILHYRNHPSIVMWCGRNEGVPSPILNKGLIELTSTLDGTRYYSPSSNQVNLQNSGPYRFQQPSLYYTTLNHGFSVETGIPSLSTLESFSSWIPKADQWPISDAWAYHDWHQSGNGEIAPFMAELEAEFGAGTSLEDFERKAQMLNYTEHRAIFEGMNAHLWAPNSGRMLWMTQPAWPSTMWQILSSDYDTQASFYGVKKACEPVHVQLDLSDYTVAVVNTTTAPQCRRHDHCQRVFARQQAVAASRRAQGCRGECRHRGVQAGSGATAGDGCRSGEARAAKRLGPVALRQPLLAGRHERRVPATHSTTGGNAWQRRQRGVEALIRIVFMSSSRTRGLLPLWRTN